MHKNSWIKRWMDLACLVASWSKDRSRKTGAVIIDERNNLIAIGWNGFVRGVNDEIASRQVRPDKYKWTEHAERNAIYNAAANGHPVKNCYMFIPWYPCADCARAIIQSGIIKLYCTEPDWIDEQWSIDFAIVCEMLEEAEITVEFVEGYAPLSS